MVNELNGEKIDIIPWSEVPEEFIAKALAPAEVLKTVITSPEEKTCTVIVPNNQLSLAIGNKGQNAKLAAKLTGFKIDIKPQFDTITNEEAPELSPDFKLPEREIVPEETADEETSIEDTVSETTETAAEIPEEEVSSEEETVSVTEEEKSEQEE